MIAPGIAPLFTAERIGHSLTATAADLAAAYAGRGESLEIFLRDLDAGLAAAGLPAASAGTLRAAAIAWGDAAAERYLDVSCRDPESGLTSVHHLREHVTRLLAQPPVPRSGLLGRRSTRYVLLVVERVAPQTDDGPMRAINDVMRTTAGPSEVLAALTSRRSVSLLRRAPHLATRVRRLDQRLNDGSHGPRHAVAARVWIEDLPEQPEGAALLIDGLCR